MYLDEAQKKFEMKAALASLFAVIGLVIGWMVNNQATTITVVATVVVWIVNMAAQRAANKRIGRTWLTIILFGVAIILSLIFTPVSLPAFPSYTGDPTLYAQALLDFMTALITIGSGIVAGATVLYNTLSRQVFDKLAIMIRK